MVIPIILAIVLWKLAPWIAKKMLAGVEAPEASSPITIEEVQTVAISILGLLFVFETVPGFVANALNYLHTPQLSVDSDFVALSVSASTIKATVMNATKIALGLWLFFGARGFVWLLQRLHPPNAS
jgi:hypothetical protein